MKISQENILFLERNSSLATLIDNSYLRDTRNENFAYLKNKFFVGESLEKSQTLNTGTGLFKTVSEIFSNYTGSPEYSIDLDIEQMTQDYITYGLACVGLATKINAEGEIVPYIVHLPAEGYFYQDGIHRLARVYAVKEEDKTTSYYVYIQSFYPGYTENKLYKSSNGGILDFESLMEIPLKTIEQTRKLQEIVQTPRPNKPAIYVIKQDEMNIYPVTSEIEEIKSHVYAMDRKKVMFDCEFLKNVDSFVLFKNMNPPEIVVQKSKANIPTMIQDHGRYIYGPEDASIEFVNNNNQLIKYAMESQKDDMRILSSMTSIPLDFLGMDTAHGSLGKGSRGLLHGSFTKKIETIRKMWDRYLPSIILDINMIQRQQDINYTRPDIFSKSDTELAEEIQIALTNNLISHERAIQIYMGYTKEQAQKEMQQIIKEKKLLSGFITNDATMTSQDTPGDTGSERTNSQDDSQV